MFDIKESLEKSKEQLENDLSKIKKEVKNYMNNKQDVPEELKIAAVNCSEKVKRTQEYLKENEKLEMKNIIERYK